MSLDATSLDPARIAGGIKAALIAMGADPVNPATTQFALDIAAAVVSEFTNNAELVVTIPPDGTGTIT